jgi:hypothetical protein
MQLLRDVAQQARYQAMLTGQITQHYREQDADLQAFESAAAYAAAALAFRAVKSAGGCGLHTPGYCEARARKAERAVREIALRSEIELQRRFEMAQADRAMLRAMMAEAA